MTIKLCLLTILATASMAARLENNYLPPGNARSAGGSGNFLGAPGFSGFSSQRFGSPGSGFGSSGSGFGSSGSGFGSPGNGFGSGGSYYSPSSARFGGTGSFGSGSSFGGTGQYNRGSSSLRNNYSGASGYNQNSGPQIRILRYNSDNSGTGDYSFAFETENQIRQQEVGEQRVIGNEQATNVRGSYSYVTPEGQQVSVNYVADENGFRAEGDHLPTQPAIQPSLELNQGSSGYYPGSDNTGAYQGIEVGAARSANRQYLTPSRSNQGGYQY